MVRQVTGKKWVSIALASLGGMVGLHGLAVNALGVGRWTQAIAQNRLAQDAREVLTIAIPFNPATDQATVIPEGFTQADRPYDNARVIIGADDREPVLTREFPWSAMGRLEWQYAGDIISTCTATLIGPSAILTNSHCLMLPLPDEETGELVSTFVEANQYDDFLDADNIPLKMVFRPSMVNGISLDEADIVTYEAGWNSDYSHPKDDWAVLTLEHPLGSFYGSLGWRDIDFETEENLEESFEKINLLGYAGDFPTEALKEFGELTETAGVDRACSILGIWPKGTDLEDTLAHDCDTNPGASGGPIFAKFDDDKYYLVGLHARSTPLDVEVTLDNGVTTDVVNGGVTVERWKGAAEKGVN